MDGGGIIDKFFRFWSGMCFALCVRIKRLFREIVRKRFMVRVRVSKRVRVRVIL